MNQQLEQKIRRKYEIIRLLGNGVFSTCWKARDCKRDILVSIKKINIPLGDSLINRIELKNVVCLDALDGQQENIIQLLAIILSDNSPAIYQIYEYMDTDLLRLIRNNSLSDPHIKYITYQILFALKHIHGRGLCHSNVQPTAIFVNCDCLTKLADFQFARAQIDSDDSEDNVKNYYQRYKSIEVSRGNKPTPADDIWSLGFVLVEMVNRQKISPARIHSHIFSNETIQVEQKSSTSISSEMKDEFGKDHETSIRQINFTNLFPNLSTEGIELLSLMLSIDPNKRISAADAIKHSFFAEFHELDDFQNEISSSFGLNRISLADLEWDSLPVWQTYSQLALRFKDKRKFK